MNGLNGMNVWSLAINPSNSQIIYAGTSFGVYKTNNGGGSWYIVNGDGGSSLAIDPSDSQTVYAGSSSGGVFKSINNGETWNAVNIGLTVAGVYSLVIDPSDSRTVYAGTLNGGVPKICNAFRGNVNGDKAVNVFTTL